MSSPENTKMSLELVSALQELYLIRRQTQQSVRNVWMGPKQQVTSEHSKGHQNNPRERGDQENLPVGDQKLSPNCN